jgi:hypothetical protein
VPPIVDDRRLAARLPRFLDLEEMGVRKKAKTGFHDPVRGKK